MTRCQAGDPRRKDGLCKACAVTTVPVMGVRIPLCERHAESWLGGDVLVRNI